MEKCALCFCCFFMFYNSVGGPGDFCSLISCNDPDVFLLHYSKLSKSLNACVCQQVVVLYTLGCSGHLEHVLCCQSLEGIVKLLNIVKLVMTHQQGSDAGDMRVGHAR